VLPIPYVERLCSRRSGIPGQHERPAAEALEKDGRVFLSGTKIRRKRVLRACSVNHRLRRQDAEFLLEVIREVACSLLDTVLSD